jgi:hypothetical protein
MTRRLDKSWLVFASIEDGAHNRCVGIFVRPDGTYGFEEFRRDVEDEGYWAPVQHYSGVTFSSRDEAPSAARRVIFWLSNVASNDGAG